MDKVEYGLRTEEMEVTRKLCLNEQVAPVSDACSSSTGKATAHASLGQGLGSARLGGRKRSAGRDKGMRRGGDRCPQKAGPRRRLPKRGTMGRTCHTPASSSPGLQQVEPGVHVGCALRSWQGEKGPEAG